MHDPRLSGLFERYRRQGDLSALAKLFDELSPELMRVARHVAARGVDPEDVVQATFLASIERADVYDPSRPIVPWLMGILINQARLMNRRRATRYEESSEHVSASAAREPDPAEAHEVQAAVARAVAELPPTYREVLEAHLAEGKPPHEIARELGRPQGTVRAQIHRGLRLVRRSLPAGFSLGVLALLDRGALAGVRREVLAAAARAQSLPPSAVPAAPSGLGLGLLAACALLAAVVGIAWAGARGPGARPEVAVVPAEQRARAAELVAAEARPRAVAAPRVTDADPRAGDETAAEPVLAFGSVRVRVLDARDEPVAGARVDLLAWGDAFWFERVRTLSTDVAGLADFPRVPVGIAGVHLEGGGIQSREDVRAGERTEFVLRLERGIDVAGIVVDARGLPIAGAIVEIGPGPQLAPRRAAPPTGPDGRFALSDVGRALAMWARSPAHAPSAALWFGTPGHAATASVETRLVLLDPVEPVVFTVVDTRGTPIPGAVATVLAPTREAAIRADGSVVLSARGARAVADGAGVVRLAAEAGRAGRVLVTALPHAQRELEFAEIGATVVLAEGARLFGTARFDDGLPADQAQIEARFEGCTEPLRAFAGADGAWAVSGAPAGAFVLRARAAPDAPAAETHGVVATGGEHRWDARLQHALTIRGRALSAHGRAAKTWLVKAVREDAGAARPPAEWLGPAVPDLRQCYTDDDGSFSVPCEPGATYRLELRPRASWKGSVLAALDGVAAGAQGVVLRVGSERGYFRARLVDGSGRPAAGSLVAVHAGSGATHRAEAQPDGAVERDVRAGRYVLYVWPVGRAPLHLGERVVGEEQALDLGDVRVDAAGALRVRGAAGRRLALHGPGGLPRELEADGADLVARALPPGDYVLLADAGEASRAVRVEAGSWAVVP
ncbi:MAG: sigma-70 family RNA polymerase sigma factor [Planctomycetes bacterium]|nr:sigma-70 family RNA polymerase sigma factor [Planctomycetota bacterium]